MIDPGNKITILSHEDAISMIGEGIHTAVRRTDDEKSHALWMAIHDSGPVWGMAIDRFLRGFEGRWHIAVVTECAQ